MIWVVFNDIVPETTHAPPAEVMRSLLTAELSELAGPRHEGAVAITLRARLSGQASKAASIAAMVGFVVMMSLDVALG
jgi:hypothetical protein